MFRNFDVENVAEFTKFKAHSRKNCKTAIVATSNLSYGLSRMYEAFSLFADQDSEVKVFKSLTEDLIWITN